jgi:general secretion pathway protein F
MFDFIVPKLSVVFAGMKDLPFYTRFMLSISSFVQQYQLIMLGGVILLGFFITRIKKKQWFVRIYDAVMLKIPGVRNMYLTLENLRFVSSLAILLKNKVVISDALEYGVKVVGNSYVKNKLLNVKNEVRQGNKLSVVMAKTDLFSDAFDGLIEIGEQTGNLAGIFHEMEIRLKTDYENSVSAMIKIIEPVMIVVMGSIVGSVVIVMLLSIVSLNEIGF